MYFHYMYLPCTILFQINHKYYTSETIPNGQRYWRDVERNPNTKNQAVLSNSFLIRHVSFHTYLFTKLIKQWFTAELFCGQRLRSGAPWVRKFGNLLIWEILLLTSAYACPYRLWGLGRGVLRQLDNAFGQPAFFLAVNHMNIVAFEKEVSLKG